MLFWNSNLLRISLIFFCGGMIDPVKSLVKHASIQLFLKRKPCCVKKSLMLRKIYVLIGNELNGFLSDTN